MCKQTFFKLFTIDTDLAFTGFMVASYVLTLNKTGFKALSGTELTTNARSTLVFVITAHVADHRPSLESSICDESARLCNRNESKNYLEKIWAQQKFDHHQRSISVPASGPKRLF